MLSIERMTQEKQRKEDRGWVTDEPHSIILSKGLKIGGEYKRTRARSLDINISGWLDTSAINSSDLKKDYISSQDRACTYFKSIHQEEQSALNIHNNQQDDIKIC